MRYNYRKEDIVKETKMIKVESDTHKMAKQKALAKDMSLQDYIAKLVQKDK